MKKIIFTLFTLFSTTALAGEQSGKVDTLYARAADNLHLVSLKGGSSRTNQPSCATQGYWLIKDEKSAAGKSQFSQLLAAKLSGKTVLIRGLNSCNRWGDGEDINTVIIID